MRYGYRLVGIMPPLESNRMTGTTTTGKNVVLQGIATGLLAIGATRIATGSVGLIDLGTIVIGLIAYWVYEVTD